MGANDQAFFVTFRGPTGLLLLFRHNRKQFGVIKSTFSKSSVSLPIATGRLLTEIEISQHIVSHSRVDKQALWQLFFNFTFYFPMIVVSTYWTCTKVDAKFTIEL